MKIEVKRFKLDDGREGCYAPIGNGLIKMLFDDGDMVIVKEAEPKHEPIRSSDEIAALEIQVWLKSRGSDRKAWKKVSSLAKCFGAKRLTIALKQRITNSLLECGIRLDPPLDDLSSDDTVSFNYINPETFPLVFVQEASSVVAALKRGKGDPRFAVFMFVSKGDKDDAYINLQYSVENEVIGLDWVLLGDENIRDMEKVKAFASSHGHQLTKCVMNDVEYLRVEGEGIAELGMRILSELYQIAADEKVKLYAEGFTWPINR